ncbi:hypothetical protein ACU4GH_10705 [Bradyrhizobium betae]
MGGIPPSKVSPANEGETVTNAVQILSAAFAFGAAVLWLLASITKTPERIPPGPLKGSLFDVFDEIHVSIAKQSRRNAWAAASAAMAALLQAIQIFL